MEAIETKGGLDIFGIYQDNQQTKYRCIGSTESEAVMAIISNTIVSGYSFFIFRRAQGGQWLDRESPEFYLVRSL